MSKLTKNQHNVPAFYLRQWANAETNNVVCHDLDNEISFETSPSNILARRYFYEENREVPDNRVEKILADMEGQVSIHFATLNNLTNSPVNNYNHSQFIRDLNGLLTKETCKAIKIFAAYQYLRVPGAIDQKRYELATTELM
jgi:hypothetical protein